MNTLFNTSFDDDPRPHDLPGVRLRANSYELQETNVRLKLTLVDTVGFGDQVNKDNSFKVHILVQGGVAIRFHEGLPIRYPTSSFGVANKVQMLVFGTNFVIWGC